MPAIEGDRPGGATPSPSNPSDGPPKGTIYSSLSAGGQLKVISLLGKDFQETLAEMAAEREAAVAGSHVKAA